MNPVVTLPVALAILVVAGTACGGEPADDANTDLLSRPEDPAFSATAPDVFEVRFETTEGDFTIRVDRALAPNGADRFYNLVRNGFYDDVTFFRVIEGFMAQFGLHGAPRVALAWAQQTIPDDPPARSNTRGTVSFAMRGPDTRTTQLFINFTDNTNLDGQGFAPIGEVVEGMDVVDGLHSGYGEMAPQGGGPAPRYIMQRGTPWLRKEYANLDYIRRARIVDDAAASGP